MISFELVELDQTFKKILQPFVGQINDSITRKMIEEQIANTLSNEISREIDKEILWGMLEGMGWTRVLLLRLTDNHHAIDITNWLEKNCQGSYERSGRDFIFEDKKDAAWFILKWK